MAEHTQPSSPNRPEELTAESPFTLPGFFAALAEERLVGAHCELCDNAMIPPRPACYACGSRDVTLRDQPQEGTIESYTLLHRPPAAFKDRAPFLLGIIELASGARLTGRINASDDDVSIGDAVKLVIEEPSRAEHAVALPYEDGWPIHAFTLTD